jgi:A-macroglobulin TED domain/MG2 domain/CarboxypepD_reg-like domain/TonB-dependent Receptor Plug Domain/Alpha-2-macroglobulin family
MLRNLFIACAILASGALMAGNATKWLEEHPFIAEIVQKLSLFSDAEQTEKLYVQTDRTLITPGEDVWFKVYMRDANSLKAAQQSDIVYAELYAPNGSKKSELTLIGQNGGAAGHFNIPADAAGGIWKIKVFTNWSKFAEDVLEREITVQRTVLPHLNMKMEFERKGYGAGEAVEAKIDLNSLDNKALANYAFSYIVKLKGNEIARNNATTDAAGHAVVKFNLPKDLATSDGQLSVVLEYQGQSESISKSIPINLSKIDLQLLPEGGDMLADVQNKIAFKAIDEFGKPSDVRGIITDSKGKTVANFDSYHAGMGAFSFQPNATETYMAQITSPAGVDEKYLMPSALQRGYSLHCESEKDNLKLTVHSTENEALILVMMQRGKAVFTKVLDPKKGAQNLNIATAELPIGAASLTLFDSKRIARAERMVFVNADKQLQITMRTNKDKYAPREKVKMTVEVRDERGMPMPGNFSMAVVDDKQLSFADDKQPNILAQILLQSDLKGDIDEPNFYFDKKEEKAAKALDFLMLTQGWRKFSWEAVLDKPIIKNNKKGEKSEVAGTVLDANSKPLAGVTIIVKDQPKLGAARTDANGKFLFNNIILTKAATLVLSNGKEYNGLEKTITEYAEDIIIAPIFYIKGNVKDERGEPIFAATAQLWYNNQPTNLGTITDEKGNFIIKNIPNLGPSKIVISYIGYSSIEMNNPPMNTSQPIEFKLKESQQLNDVVIVNANRGNIKREKSAGVQSIKAEDIKRAPAAPRKSVAKPSAAAPRVQADAPKPVMAPPPPPAPMEFENDKTSAGKALSAKDVAKMPVKNLESVVSATAGVVGQADEGKDITVRGSREDGNVYMVDGVRVAGGALPPAQDVEKFEVIAGGLPAAFGDESGRGIPAIGRNNGPGLLDAQIEEKREEKKDKKRRAAEKLNVNWQNPADAAQKNTKYTTVKEFYAPQYTIREKVKARSDFRKTLYWNPNLIIGNNGRCEVEFYCNDDISQFRAIVEGFASDGGIGRGEHVFFTQLPLQMTCKIPTQALTGDVIAIPLTLTNNSGEATRGRYEVTVPKGFQPINTPMANAVRQDLNLAAGESKTFFITYTVGDSLGKLPIGVYFYNADGTDDNITETVRVNPRGFPVHGVMAGTELKKTFEVNISSPVQNSLRVKLVAHPNTIGEVLRGLESMLGTPGGCFEQTSSTNYPNVMVLNYLRESAQSSKEIEDRCKGFLDVGYGRLKGYECTGGGFHWWGGATAHEALTAMGIMQFEDMSKVYPVDKGLITRATSWLFSRRDGAGAWKEGTGALHTWVTDGTVRNAFLAYAMTEGGYTNQIKTELDFAYANAKKGDDVYSKALIINALYNANDKKRADELLQDVLKLQEKDGSWNGASHSITASTGHALKVETTALLVLAILKQKTGVAALPKAMDFLAKAKTNFGYGNTQATVLALKALVEHTKYAKRTAESGDIVVYVDGARAKTAHFKADEKNDIIINGLERYIREGNHKIEVRFENCKDAMPYELEVEYTTTLPIADKNCKIDIDTKLASDNVKMGETVRLSTVIKNKTAAAVPSTMAIIGIPAGLSPQIWQLKELRDKKIADYYEIFDGYVVLHYASLTANETREINLDLKADIPGTYEAPASSAFLYYTNENKDWDKPSKIVVR